MTTTETNKTTGGPKSTALLGALLCGAALLPVPATAQAGTPDHDPRLVRAIALEETEHDTAAALKIYRSVQADPSARPEVRTRAALRAALAARAMGDLDVADAALRVAAQGAGSAAARARQMLQDPQRQGADEIDVRVLQLVATLRDGYAANVVEEIVFYGGRAVPVVTRVIDGEAGDMQYVKRLALCIWRIGDEEARAWLRSARQQAPALKRRAIVAGAWLMGPGHAVAADIFPELTVFLGDSDPMVRVEALSGGSGAYMRYHPIGAVAPLLADADDRVREAAERYLTGDPGLRNIEPDIIERARAVLSLLRASPEIPHEAAIVLFGQAFSKSELWERAAGRAVLVDGMALPIAGAADRLGLYGLQRRNFGADELYDELLRAAQVHGACDDPRPGSVQSVLQMLVSNLSVAWRKDAVPAALELERLGYAVQDQFWNEIADREVWRQLLLASQPQDERTIVQRSQAAHNARGAVLDAGEVQSLRDWVATMHRDGLAAVKPKDVLQALAQVGYLLASQPGEDAGAWAASQIVAMGEPGSSAVSTDIYHWARLRWMLFAGMTRQHDAVRMQQVRGFTMTADFDDPAIRNYALGWLLHHGVEDPFELLQTALPMPLHALGTAADRGVVGDEMPELARAPRGLKYPTGVTWLCIDDFHPYSEDQVRAIVLRLLDTGSAEAWSAAAAVWSTQVRPGEPWLRDAMILRWEKCDRLETPYRVIDARTSRSVRGERSPTSWEQQPPSTAVLLAALGCLRAYALEVQGDERGSRQKDFYDLLGEVVASRPELREAPAVIADLELLAELDAGPLDGRQQIYRFQALDQLMSYQPERVDELVARFGTEDPQFRYIVFAQRLEMAAVDRVGLVRAMLDDSYSSTRLRACGLAAELLTRDLVEPLIERLRDENAGVRTAAQQALEATRYYLEQQAVFRRLLDDEALGSSASAAEALVRQVRDSGNELPIRVAAITSLGTLGVPETLPILIELMKAEQAELRAAATQAVERINSRTSELPVSSEGTGK